MKPMSPDRLKRMAKMPGARLDMAEDDQLQEVAAPTVEAAPAVSEAISTQTTLTLDKEATDGLCQSMDAIADKLVRAAIEQSDSREQFAKMLTDAIRDGVGAMQVNHQRHGRWVFTVKRDLRGLIETIEAKAS